MRRVLLIGALLISLGGCAAPNDPCVGKSVYVGMPIDQALPILQQCGRLQAEAAGGISSWVFQNRVVTVEPKQGVSMIVNLN
jgi:hypothetical protein